MQLRPLILVALLAVACSQEATRSPWPAHIVMLDGMSEEEKSEVTKVVEELNALAESPVVTFDSAPTHFKIAVKKSTESEEVKERAGFATVGSQTCSIDLSSLLFKSGMKDYILPVVFHELGHCAGLGHSETEGEIMFKATNPNRNYSEEAIERFIQEFKTAAGI